MTRCDGDDSGAPVAWLSNEHIEDQLEEGHGYLDIDDMLGGSAQTVGGIVCEVSDKQQVNEQCH